MTQYQRELKSVLEAGGDVEQFKKNWHNRACDAYRKNVKTTDDIHKFRSGGFNI